MIFLPETFVRLMIIGTYSYHNVSGFQQLTVMIPQIAGFYGATQGIVLRIEIQNHFLAAKLFG